jgi:ARG and Rhodanese-Phosphatase-superfamily-associated Protein domain
MQIFSLAAASLAVLSFAAGAPRPSFADTKTRISGPEAYKNLAVYFIHGPSAQGPVPLTLQEAFDKGSVRVLETGTVNELKVENTGDEDIFIQSGDIVKGGKQDRVLRMSFVLPPKSGAVSIAAFCVEAGRWSARGSENVGAFMSAAEAMPSREAKLAMRAPMETAAMPAASAAASPQRRAAADPVHLRQQEVWASVAATQSKLSEELSADVASPRSETSLQLSLENKQLQQARAGYMSALEGASGQKGDIVGYAIAINGKVASADVYPSNALFRKMWPKQLAAAVTEAIGAKGGDAAAAPSAEAVQQFLAAAESGRGQEEVVGDLSRQEVRDADKALFVEAQRSSGAWVHRNYLAK